MPLNVFAKITETYFGFCSQLYGKYKSHFLIWGSHLVIFGFLVVTLLTFLGKITFC